MSSLINPEYKVKNGSQYIPFNNGVIGVKKDPVPDTDIVALKDGDDRGGVSLWGVGENGNTLILDIDSSENVKANFNNDTKKLTLEALADRVQKDEGITVTRHGVNSHNVSIGIDKVYLEEFIRNRKTKLTGGEGIVIDPIEGDDNNKLIKLDEDYVIRQGEY